MKRIPLTQGQFALVDDEDFERMSLWKWHADWDKTTCSYRAKRQLTREGGQQRSVYMHRVIIGAKKGLHVDHKNHDTLDNRRSNLRECTCSQNTKNKRIYRNNTSGIKGVTWVANRNRWCAQIMTDYKRHILGFFVSASDAARAYELASKKFHGEFSCHTD